MSDDELIRLRLDERWRRAESRRGAWAAPTRRKQAGIAAARRSAGLRSVRAGCRPATT